MRIPFTVRRWTDPRFRAVVVTDLQRIMAHVRDDGPFGFRAEIAGGAYHLELEGVRWPVARAHWESFAWVLAAVRCALTDHDWVDDSYGGPESGCMAGHCRRCGWSFHTQLY
jgi:hypothetical protein